MKKMIKASATDTLTNKEARLATQLSKKYKEILDLLEVAPDKLMNSTTIYDDIMDEAQYLENL